MNSSARKTEELLTGESHQTWGPHVSDRISGHIRDWIVRRSVSEYGDPLTCLNPAFELLTRESHQIWGPHVSEGISGHIRDWIVRQSVSE
jgi:hypothetical protein